MPQYYETECMICHKPQIASFPDVICNECEQTSAVTDRIKKLEQALKNMLDAYDTCKCGCDPDETWQAARALFPEKAD